MKFTVYQVDTGQVLFCGECDNPEMIAKSGQSVRLNEKLDSGWILEGKHSPLPPKPTEHHTFNYIKKQWQDPRTALTEWVVVRAKRDDLLSDTDWVVTKALEFAGPVSAPWKAYRKALRDITLQTDPFAVVWPVLPTA